MLRLRLEVVASENLNDVCAQATRIATHLGIEVVFELNGKDVVAKPGMNADSLVHECGTEAPAAKVKESKAPKEPKEPKEQKGKPKETPVVTETDPADPQP